MKTTTKQLSDTKVELTVVLDKEDLAPVHKKAVERLAKDVKAKGFRKGKAPANVAEKLLDPNQVNSTALDIAVRTTVPLAFEQSKKVAIMLPNVEVTKFVPGETVEYKAVADILPDIKLGNYKNLKVKKEDLKVTDKDMKEVLENIAKAYAEKKAVKRKAKLTDEVIIDFTGKLNGEPFEGGSAKDHHLELGSGAFIPGFEDGVVGHEPGDKFEINLTFPKDYHAEHLKGKKVVFEVLLKQVNEVVVPKYDDEFAKKCGPFKNMDELKADIKKNLQAQNDHKVMEKYKDDLVEAFVKSCKVSAPEVMVDDQVRFIKDDISRNAASQGLKFEDYLKQIKQTEKDWEKEARKVAEKRVKASLCLQILARDEKIEVDDALVDAKIAELCDVYKKSKEALANLKTPQVRQEIKNRMTIEKTLDFLVDANK
ncbi:trigger factor [Candidatus Saccharibacteria bacterium]|nr:trigger factor [Candidatus Saccharibacteria bacterium]